MHGLQDFFNYPEISPVEIMEVVAVPDEFLFPVLAGIHRRPEIADNRCLERRAERAEGCIDIVCLRPDRAVRDPIDDLHPVPAGKWHAGQMAGKALHKHAEPGKEEF